MKLSLYMLSKSFIKIIFVSLLLYSCQSDVYPWYTGSIDKAKQSAGTKLIMLDFYTPTWGGCLRLDAETFTDRDVISFSKENFISLKLDATTFPGDSLYSHYKCKGVPSLVFINKEDQEIDRIVGFREPNDYLNSI